MTIITRFAPSPTGFLHLGHAFSAQIAFNQTQEKGGTCLLRIENIDQNRCHVKFEDAIYEDLAWLGFTWPTPVLRQSERLHKYKVALEKLIKKKMLYACFCSRKSIQQEIRNIASAPHTFEGTPYPGICKKLSHEVAKRKINNGEQFSLRLDMEKAISYCGALYWDEIGKGKQKATPERFGDIVVARKDIPTSYHLSVVVDDHAQSITQVTRGIDLFASTHIHRILQSLLEIHPPKYLHHNLIMDKSGKRLSKRDQSTTLRGLRKSGKSPDAIFEMLLNR